MKIRDLWSNKKSKYGELNVGRQVYIRIYIEGRNTPIICILDNIVKDGKKYILFDAKSSVIKNLKLCSVSEIIFNFATKNQKEFYDALKNKRVTKVVPFGKRARELWDVEENSQLPKNILNDLERKMHFYVNDLYTEGYKIWDKYFTF